MQTQKSSCFLTNTSLGNGHPSMDIEWPLSFCRHVLKIAEILHSGDKLSIIRKTRLFVDEENGMGPPNSLHKPEELT